MKNHQKELDKLFAEVSNCQDKQQAMVLYKKIHSLIDTMLDEYVLRHYEDNVKNK